MASGERRFSSPGFPRSLNEQKARAQFLTAVHRSGKWMLMVNPHVERMMRYLSREFFSQTRASIGQFPSSNERALQTLLSPRGLWLTPLAGSS